MAQDPRHAVREWLEAEQAGQPDAADRAFAQAAAALPRLQPSARFADAVLARLGVPPQAAPDLWASWWLRGLVGAALVSVGVLVVSLSGGAWISALVASVHTVAWGLGQAGTAVSAWVGSALIAWAGVAHAAVVLGRLLSGPGAILMLMLNLTVAAAALVALRRLVPMQEN
jgi:hypothetical protein